MSARMYAGMNARGIEIGVETQKIKALAHSAVY